MIATETPLPSDKVTHSSCEQAVLESTLRKLAEHAMVKKAFERSGFKSLMNSEPQEEK